MASRSGWRVCGHWALCQRTPVTVCSVQEEDGLPYRASIPMLHATTPEADVLLVYEMNGKVQTSA